MRVFGLIGYPLGHSFSAKYFAEKFAREGIADCQYLNFEIEQIEQLPALLAVMPDLAGFNVTIPHKQAVIPFLDRLSDEAAAIGAVNCVRVERDADGRIVELVGHNTDAGGFRSSLLDLIGDERPDALVLGSGGAAQAVVYVLRAIGLNFRVISRSSDASRMTYDEVTDEVIARNRLIVNTTPLGMVPNIDALPALPYDALTPRHFLYDLVYNPPFTRFLAQGQARGAHIKNGEQMLAAQAEASWGIWNNH